MSVTVSPLLRDALFAEAAVCGGLAILMMGGASPLSPWLGLPSGLLLWAGAALLPFVAMLAVVANRESASRNILIDIVAIKALWVAASFGLLFSGAIEPSLLGKAFVTLQALLVAVLAELQFIELRHSFKAAA
jgi:hypothetical protein